jgi:hypothetical protein
MTTTLKIIGYSPTWEHLERQEWPVEISLDKRYDYGSVHSFTHNGEEYLFEIKETQIHNKVLLIGWLNGENKAGNIIFEIQ